MDLQEYPGSMPACFEKGLPRCPVKAVIPTMTMETTDGIKKLQNTVVHVIQNNATYYVDDKHRITEICSDPVERNNYNFEENPENFRGQLVFDYDNQRGVYYNNRAEIFNLVVDGLSFDSLTNRPKYNGSEMTHATNIPLVPTQLSQLENDSGFITESVVTDDIAAHNVDPTAHADIRQAITDEATARATADNTLDGKITAEENARIAADNALATADSVLDGKITAEATARAAADDTLDGKITTEITDRATADATLQSNINAEATARANADTSLGNRITSEETTRSAADSALAGDISAEVTRAEAAETALGGRIDDEVTTRAAADTTLDGKITAEATARANADSTLDGKITDEATTRANADTALGTRITDETTARTNADTALGTRIDNEATARANADTAIEGKLNRNVLYDLEMETDANNVTFVEDKINLKTGVTTTERDVIPAASTTTAGTISASEYVSLVDAEEKITALLEGAVAIDNLPANPTQAQLTAAWKTATGKDELINRASIYDSANQLVHTYYTNVSEWEDSPAGGQITIDQFTNNAAGIIKGSTTDGNVSANLDGTGTVSGWTSLKNTVAGKQDALTAGNNISISGSTISATDTTYSAGTGLSLTGTTFAVDTTTIAQKSDIPTVNNATLTIQKNGSTVKTFTANASTNVTANITVPTKTSDLTNDSNFPVDANYVHTDNNFTTALKNKLDGIAAGAEVNQNAFSNVKVGSTTVAADTKTDTLELVAGSNVTLTPDATNDKVTIAATVPTKTSDLTNDSGYITNTVNNLTNYTTTTGMNTALDGKVDIKTISLEYETTTILAKVKGLPHDGNTGYVRMGTLTDGGAGNISDKPVSGKGFTCVVYQTRRSSTTDYEYQVWCYVHGENRPYYTRINNDSSSITWGHLSVAAFSGSYNDLTDKPAINNATLTIQKNGTNVQTFTANSSTNKTANITVPTKVTDLTDATNYVAKDGDFYVTGEGSNFSMTGTSQNVYADLKVKGDTQQATYTGKNLVNISTLQNGYVLSDGNIAVTTENGVMYSPFIKVTPGVRYTFTVVSTSSSYIKWIGIGGYSTDNVSSFIVRTTIQESTISFTASDNVNYVILSATNLAAATKIQFEVSNTPTSYEPYVGGIPAPNPGYPQEVEVVTGSQVIASMGKNLYKTPASTTDNGVKYTLNPDGTYDVKGTATAQSNAIIYDDLSKFTNGATYTLSCNKSSLPSYVRILLEGYNGSTWVRHAITGGGASYLNGSTVEITGTLNLSGCDRLRLVLRTDNGKTVALSGLGVQLEKGSTATTYEPYRDQSYEVDLQSLNKNILDASTLSLGYVAYDGTIVGVQTQGEMHSGFIKVKPNATYTFSIAETTSTYPAWFGIGEYTNDSTSGFIRRDTQTTTTATSCTITTAENCKYIIVSARNLVDATKVQLEKGSQATSYIKCAPIELCKLGTYQDYIYPSGSKWYLHKETASIDWGTLTWTMTTGTIYGTTGCTGIKYAPNNTTVIPSYAEKYIGRQGSGLSNYTNYYAIDTNKVNVQKGSSGAPNPTGMFYYPLATATDTEITNPLLVAQLDDLWRNLQSGTNTTNVNVEGDLPAILGVTAFTNTLASAMAGINERMNRLPAIPQITMTSTDPGEGQPLADNHFIAVYSN